jgi:phosphate transport system permease protein
MKLKEKIFYIFDLFFALVPVIIVIAIFGFLTYYSIPSMRYNGVHFFESYLWNPGQIYRNPITVGGVVAPYGSSFGMLLFFYGTVLISLLSIMISLPVSLIVALELNLYISQKTSKFLSSLIDLFAGIPSVVYGLWGIAVLEPFLFVSVEPWMNKNLSFIPGFSGQIYSGAGIIASTIILSLMTIPIITAVIYNSMKSVSKNMIDGALALGATRWEIGKKILFRETKIQIFGATMLGLGRALGETMAVLMVSGSIINTMPQSIYSSINTMAAAIASLLDSAFTDPTGMELSALAELGLVLMLITLMVSLIGRLLAGTGITKVYEDLEG